MLYGVFVFSGSSEYIYSSVYEVKIGPFRSINSFHLILKPPRINSLEKFRGNAWLDVTYSVAGSDKCGGWT